jgi:hypothetical protein
MKVTMKNPKTGETKEIKVGWSWTLFLFSGFLGLPLFLRRLNIWGGIFLVFWLISIGTNSTEYGKELMWPLFFAAMGLQIFVGRKGNEMTAKNYLEYDWQFVNPDSDSVRFAKSSWGIQN